MNDRPSRTYMDHMDEAWNVADYARLLVQRARVEINQANYGLAEGLLIESQSYLPAVNDVHPVEWPSPYQVQAVRALDPRYQR